MVALCLREQVSMESGLEDRNNQRRENHQPALDRVSMESGLEDRNNRDGSLIRQISLGLNGVRPRRPEQWLASEGHLG